MKVLHIGWNSVRRMLREPSNLFFVFIFPMLLIIVLGASFGGGFTPRLGIIVDSGDGEFSDQLVAALEADDDLETSTVGTQAALTDGVERVAWVQEANRCMMAARRGRDRIRLKERGRSGL